MLLSQAEGALRADLAVVLNRQHSVEKTVLLDEGSVDHTLVGVLLWGVLENVTLLFGSLLNGSCGIGVSLTILLNVDVAAITNEWRGDLVVFILVLRVDITEFAESEVRRRCKVKRLCRELILSLVRYSLCDVVVSLGTTDAAPEEQLLKVRLLAFVKQSLQAKV